MIKRIIKFIKIQRSPSLKHIYLYKKFLKKDERGEKMKHFGKTPHFFNEKIEEPLSYLIYTVLRFFIDNPIVIILIGLVVVGPIIVDHIFG